MGSDSEPRGQVSQTPDCLLESPGTRRRFLSTAGGMTAAGLTHFTFLCLPRAMAQPPCNEPPCANPGEDDDCDPVEEDVCSPDGDMWGQDVCPCPPESEELDTCDCSNNSDSGGWSNDNCSSGSAGQSVDHCECYQNEDEQDICDPQTQGEGGDPGADFCACTQNDQDGVGDKCNCPSEEGGNCWQHEFPKAVDNCSGNYNNGSDVCACPPETGGNEGADWCAYGHVWVGGYPCGECGGNDAASAGDVCNCGSEPNGSQSADTCDPQNGSPDVCDCNTTDQQHLADYCAPTEDDDPDHCEGEEGDNCENEADGPDSDICRCPSDVHAGPNNGGGPPGRDGADLCANQGQQYTDGFACGGDCCPNYRPDDPPGGGSGNEDVCSCVGAADETQDICIVCANADQVPDECEEPSDQCACTQTDWPRDKCEDLYVPTDPTGDGDLCYANESRAEEAADQCPQEHDWQPGDNCDPFGENPDTELHEQGHDNG